jgi:hemerythrin superfamily protein
MSEQIDVIDVLMRDHRLIRSLAERLDTVSDPVELGQVCEQIIDVLIPHERAEQTIVFPALQPANADLDESVRHRTSEHHEIDLLLDEMVALDPSGFAFTKRSSALVLELRDHFDVEEQTVFARLRETLATDALVRLAGEVCEFKQRVADLDCDSIAVQ